MIGINQLKGEEEKLDKPLMVGRIRKSREESAIETVAEITKKIVFKTRPVPIMSQTKVKTA